MKIGLFDHIGRADRPLATLFDERLEFYAEADEAGFWGVHIAEHHASPVNMAPSPSLFLAALAVSGDKRMSAAPQVPTFAEGGVSGVDLLTWWGAMVPAGTPDAIVQKIHGWFEQALKEKDTADYLREQANDVMITPLAEAQTLLRKSEQEWKRLVEETGVEKI